MSGNTSTLPSMGGLNFSGANAFPAATQAAFGGMGGMGYGVGYGGTSQGASITFTPASTQPQAAPTASAPSGGATDYTAYIIIAAAVIIGLVVVMAIAGKEDHGGSGGRHRRH